MAGKKRSRTRSTRTLKGASRRKAGRSRASAVAPKDPEGHVDGCDVEIPAALATSDAELPPARGGIEITAQQRRRARRT